MKSAEITVSIGTISLAANSTNTIGYIKNKWFDELDTNPIIIHSNSNVKALRYDLFNGKIHIDNMQI